MPIENATYIKQMSTSNPAATDPVADTDNHLKLIKACVKNTFPQLDGPVNADPSDFLGLVPRGAIVMWSGTTTNVPSGWAICNGQTVSRSDGNGSIVTPDLRERIPIGASQSKLVKNDYPIVSKNFNPGTGTATTVEMQQQATAFWFIIKI